MNDGNPGSTEMEDHLQEPDDAEGGPILRFPGASVENVFRADGGLDDASSSSAKRSAPRGTWTTPQSTLDTAALLSPEHA
jgi:hypothetical protein